MKSNLGQKSHNLMASPDGKSQMSLPVGSMLRQSNGSGFISNPVDFKSRNFTKLANSFSVGN